MLKNYINVALRNLLRQKFYSILNVLGLTIGLVCFLMIGLFVVDELSYDRFHKDAESIYRINFYGKLNGSEILSARVGPPMAAAMKADYPEVLDASRLNTTGNWFIKEKGTTQTFKEETVLMADENFFSFWTVELIYGDPKTCLQRPNTLVLDFTTAKKIFGEENPVGKVLVLDNEDDFEVTGVYADLPSASHFHHNILLSMSTFERYTNMDAWLSTNYATYIKLQEGVAMSDFQPKFAEVIEKYCAPLIQRFLNMDISEFGSTGNVLDFTLTPLTDIHLHSRMEDEIETNGDIKYVYIFSAVAIFILVLACINFMNLATARSANRAKEVGVRKMMGAFKAQLVWQFISESVLLSMVSLLLALVLVVLLIPSFGDLANKPLSISMILQPQYVLTMFVLVLLVGFMAGSYPALYLSAFRPADVLKGKVRQGVKSGSIRSVLVVFQFSISIIMIIATAIVFDQLNFIQDKKLGYNKEQIVMVNDAWILRDKCKSFMNEVDRSPEILGSTLGFFTPVNNHGNSNLHFKEASPTPESSMVISQAVVDHDYQKVMGIEMLAGRFFSRDFTSDSTACIINEAAVKAFGYEKPIGDKLYTHGDNDEIVGHRIVGVVQDFHYRSLREKVAPLVLRLGDRPGYAMFKVDGNNIEATLDHIQDKWDEFAPGQPFAYQFMDQKFDQLYESEQKVGEIFTVFAILAILIACLGLFGLAAFTAEQKTKEIGIRKVLGASVSNIVNLLSMGFLKLVMVSFVIAIPVSYFAMMQWLDDFAYRTEIKPTTFALAGMAALVVAWATIGFQSWKAARANPVKSLRDE